MKASKGALSQRSRWAFENIVLHDEQRDIQRLRPDLRHAHRGAAGGRNVGIVPQIYSPPDRALRPLGRKTPKAALEFPEESPFWTHS